MLPPLDVAGAVARQAAAESPAPEPAVSRKRLLLMDPDTGKLVASFPETHKPGMRVPKGGSTCATCKWFEPGAGGVAPSCREPNFIAWDGGADKPAGSPVIPQPQDEYCSDWWEPA